MNAVEIKNLTKTYGRARGVDDISFSIKEGEIFGFIGPNGAGKSTTIRTLLALIHQNSGEALIFGKAAAEHPEILEEVGYLPSEVFYYDNMKVIDLLKYSASFYKKDCTKRMMELSKLLQLDLNRKIEDLSYGNRKKVGIVQGLMHEPKLIILDEPTGGLDPLMQQTFFKLLRDENEKGATVFMSSHILSEVEKLCDRVAIIKGGKIIALESIMTLKEKNHKRVHLELNTEIDEHVLKLSGITDVEVDGKNCSFLYAGNINGLMKLLSTIDLKNVSLGEPELEEIFYHYYEKEE